MGGSGSHVVSVRIVLGKRIADRSRGSGFCFFPERARREFRLLNNFNLPSNEAMMESEPEIALELRALGACVVGL